MATIGLVAAPLTAWAAESLATAPTVTVTSAPGDPGVLVATASSADSVKTVVAEVRTSASDPAPLATVNLVQDGAGDTWRSPRLELGTAGSVERYRDYQVSVVATDSNGEVNPTAATAVLHYLKQPVVVAHRATPTTLDVQHVFVVASGTLEEFDPATGSRHPAGGGTVEARWTGSASPVASATVQDDGQYAIKLQPTGPTGHPATLTVALKDAPGTARLEDTPHGTSFLDQVDVTANAGAGRVQMNTTKVTVKYPAKLSMAGRVLVGELPVPDATVRIAFKGKPAGSVQSDAEGRFAVLSTPRYDGTYTFSWTPSTLQSPYVTGVTTGSETVSVTDRTSMSFVAPSIDEESVMHINGKLTTSSGGLPPKGSRVWLQRSTNGKTGWANVGSLPTSYYGFVKVEGYIPHASGYFRLHYYGGPGLQPTSSWVYRSTRRETRLIRLNASPEPVRKGATVTVTGTVQKLMGSTWTSMGKNQPVQVFFRPKGASASTPFSYLGWVRTNAAGSFTFKGKAVRDGDWTAAWFTPSRWNVNAYGYVDAVDVK